MPASLPSACQIDVSRAPLEGRRGYTRVEEMFARHRAPATAAASAAA